MNTINFSKVSDGVYESAPILMNGNDAVLHLEFASKCSIHILRSITQDKYAEDTAFSTDAKGVAEVTLTGCVSGQYIKLRSYFNPVKALCLI